MKCPNCGSELETGDKFCTVCGTNIEVQNASGATNNGMPSNTDAVNDFAAGAINGARNSLFGTGKNGVNYMVRRYFFGFGDIVGYSVIAFAIAFVLRTLFYDSQGMSIFCLIVMVLAVIAVVISIALGIAMKFMGLGKDAVDSATNNAINALKNRAINKFNVDADQLNEIEPIVMVGVGENPKLSESKLSFSVKQIAAIHAKRSWIDFRKIYKIHTKDPVEGYKVSFDRVPRYLLVQVTVYAFTDTQLLVYSGNVDIATGTVYEESTAEVFYEDINTVTKSDMLDVFRYGLFGKQYYVMKYITLDVCGITKVGSFDSRLAGNIDASLTGMQSYIRDKKNA